MLLNLLSLLIINISYSNTVNPEIYYKLRILEKKIGCKLNITSGHRTVEHNRSVGGAKRSYHLFGMAIDVQPSKKCKKGLELIFEASKDIFNGVILYPNHIHLDIRKNKYHKIFDKYTVSMLY